MKYYEFVNKNDFEEKSPLRFWAEDIEDAIQYCGEEIMMDVEEFQQMSDGTYQVEYFDGEFGIAKFRVTEFVVFMNANAGMLQQISVL